MQPTAQQTVLLSSSDDRPVPLSASLAGLLTELRDPPRAPPRSRAAAPVAAPESAPFEVVLDEPGAGPWARWFARTFDVWFHAGLVALLIGGAMTRYSPTFLRWLETPFGWKVFGLVCIPLGFLLDAAVHGLAGNTPGKALLGLRVVTIDGRRPRAGEVLERNMGVWSAGLGFGLPGIGLLTMLRQAWRLRRGLPASYDHKQFAVWARPAGRSRKLVFGLLFSTLFAVIAAFDVADRQEGRELAEVLAASSYSWTNPETGYPANIASQWKYETVFDDDGAVLHMFTQHSDHAVVVFASEALGETPLRHYTGALADKLAAQGQLTASYFEDFRGAQSWVGNGQQADGARVQMRVVQVHGQVWRVRVRQSPPFGYTDALVRDLAGELWVTVTPR